MRTIIENIEHTRAAATGRLATWQFLFPQTIKLHRLAARRRPRWAVQKITKHADLDSERPTTYTRTHTARLSGCLVRLTLTYRWFIDVWHATHIHSVFHLTTVKVQMSSINKLQPTLNGTKTSIVKRKQVCPSNLARGPRRGAVAHVTMWPNFGEISSNSYADIVFTRCFGSCLLRHWPLAFWIQNLISTSMNQNTKCICDQNWVKFFLLVFKIWCPQGFWNARTHSRTYTYENRMLPIPKVVGAEGIITTKNVHTLLLQLYIWLCQSRIQYALIWTAHNCAV